MSGPDAQQDRPPIPATGEGPEAVAGGERLFGALGILSLLLGGLLAFMGLLMWASQGLGGVQGGGALQDDRHVYVVAIGVGLLVLGAGLRIGGLFRLLRERRSLHGLNAIASVLLALVLLVLVNYVFAKHNLWRWDLTQEGRFTLSEEATQVVRNVPEGKRLRLTFIHDTRMSSPWEVSTTEALLEQLEDASPRLAVERVEPRNMPREDQADFLDRMELEGRDYRDIMGVVVETGYRAESGWTRVRHRHVSMDELWDVQGQGRQPRRQRGRRTFVGERRIVSAVREVVTAEAPKLYFLKGHREASLTVVDRRRGLATLAKILRGKSFEVAPLDLAAQERRAVPDDCDVLVLAGPQIALNDFEVKSIRAYLDRGGDAVLMLDAAEDPITEQQVEVGLEPLLAREYGIETGRGQVYMSGFDPLTRRRVVTSRLLLNQTGGADHPIIREVERYGTTRLTFHSARPLRVAKEFSAADAKAVVKTPSEGAGADAFFAAIDPERRETWQDGPFALAAASRVERPGVEASVRGDADGGEDDGVAEPEADEGPADGAAAEDAGAEDGGGADSPGAEGAEGDEGAGAEEATEETRLVVLGDADWATNGVVSRSDNQNLELMQNALAWCLDREERIVGEATRPTNYTLKLDRAQKAFLQLLTFFGLPAIAIGAGTFAYMIRRH